ncbi:hypothetical protein Tco_0977179 [Tanacetum coccineum]|uniref:Uncharacterized protein n=1 Tax=Tanacetum coccineum TaxID=301880 RepID=A0ABQ5EJV0_9ASTR
MSDKNDEINKKKNNEQDWSKVERTQDLVDYVYAKYGNSWKESNEATDEMLDNLYSFAMMKEKYLSMVESLKATKKGKAKLMMIKEKEKLMIFKTEVKKLKEDFSRILKAKKAKEANEVEEAELKVNKEVVQEPSDEGFFWDEDVVLFNDVKYPLTDAKIRMFKERPTTSKDLTRQLASTSTRSRAPSTRSIALIASTSTRSRAPTTSTSTFKAFTRYRAPIASTYNAKATSTSALIGYMKIAMTGSVLGLRAPDDHNAPPPSAPQKRKSKK